MNSDYANCVALSGIRSTQPTLHIGNYYGALKKFLALQEEIPTQAFFFIADFHSIADVTNGQDLRDYSLGVATEFLAVGLDPNKATLYFQSAIPELATMTWLLTSVCKDTDLMNLPHYREKRRKFAGKAEDITEPEQSSEEIPGGPMTYLAYPILQAADILYPASAGQRILVPVGNDQRPHIEFTRDIARVFNERYGEIFGEPKMPEDFGLFPGADDVEQQGSVRIKGFDGEGKMGKSEGNAVYLGDDPETIRKLVKQGTTDPVRTSRHVPGNPEHCLGIFPLHLFATPKSVRDATIRPGCLSGELGCVDCKVILANNLINQFAEFRERKAELLTKPDYVRGVMEAGADRVRQLVHDKVAQMSELMGLYIPA